MGVFFEVVSSFSILKNLTAIADHRIGFGKLSSDEESATGLMASSTSSRLQRS